MDSRFIAKIAVISTVAVMAFGLLSMVFAMEMGMHRCPVMSATSACPSPAMGTSLFDHHVEGFQSMTLATLATLFVAFVIVFAYSRLGENLTAEQRMHPRERWNFDTGPPSPILAVLFWSALHNKFGDIALVRVRRKMLV